MEFGSLILGIRDYVLVSEEISFNSLIYPCTHRACKTFFSIPRPDADHKCYKLQQKYLLLVLRTQCVPYVHCRCFLATLGLTALWQHGLLQINLFHSREFSEKTEDPKIHRKCYHFFIHISVLFITVFVWERKIPFFPLYPLSFFFFFYYLFFFNLLQD